jgi:hypothetical protein
VYIYGARKQKKNKNFVTSIVYLLYWLHMREYLNTYEEREKKNMLPMNEC